MDKKSNSAHGVIKEIERNNGVVTLMLAGEIDMYCSTELRVALLEIMQEKPSVTIINMENVEFMDSSGLAVLVEGLQLSRINSSQLKLVGLNKRVRGIFEISRLENIFQIYETEAEALAQ